MKAVIILLIIKTLFFSANSEDEFRHGRQQQLPVVDTPGGSGGGSMDPTNIEIITATPNVTLDVDTPSPTTPGTNPVNPTTLNPTIPSGGTNVTNLGGDGKVQFAPSGGTIVMRRGNAFIVSSSRSQRSLISGIARMRTWTFVSGDQCRLGVSCPCINLPPSYNCLSSYVKIRTGFIQDLQRFCGGNAPNNQPIQSDTGELSILFKPDTSGFSDSLFKCIVTCPPASNLKVTLPANTTTCP